MYGINYKCNLMSDVGIYICISFPFFQQVQPFTEGVNVVKEEVKYEGEVEGGGGGGGGAAGKTNVAVQGSQNTMMPSAAAPTFPAPSQVWHRGALRVLWCVCVHACLSYCVWVIS